MLDVSPGKYPHHPPSDHRLGKNILEDMADGLGMSWTQGS